MADNVVLASGALVVATAGDAANVQTQKVVDGYLTSAGTPMSASPMAPLPVDSSPSVEILTALLLEQRVTNELLYQLVYPETEQLETLRAKYKDYPVTIG